MYLISAYFDDNTNRLLQTYIDRIAQATGNNFMTDNNVPPHLTLSAIEARDAKTLALGFGSLEGKFKATPIHIVTMGQMLPYVMYVAPVLDSALFGLQNTVTNAFKTIPETMISKYYLPYSWFPHITLAKKLQKDQMQSAFCVMQEKFQPIKGVITKIGLAKVNPHEDIYMYHLK
jgi:2'-5' RNA ligase